MSTNRVDRMLAGLDLGGNARDTLDGLCLACAAEFGVTGAGVALIVGGAHRGTLGCSDATAGTLEALQETLAEGPCLDAHLDCAPVLAPALAHTARWPMFTPAALEVGIEAVFAFPLQLGSARFGALDLYRTATGPLSSQDVADAGSIAGLVTGLVLIAQAGAPPGTLPEALHDLMDQGSVVHQAAGMVSVQLDIAIEDANVALRAHAFATDRPLRAVAAEVVAGRIRLEP